MPVDDFQVDENFLQMLLKAAESEGESDKKVQSQPKLTQATQIDQDDEIQQEGNYQELDSDPDFEDTGLEHDDRFLNHLTQDLADRDELPKAKLSSGESGT